MKCKGCKSYPPSNDWPCIDCCDGDMREPITNADSVRAMDIDHLIEWFCYHRPCCTCPYDGIECGIRDWLNAEVTDGDSV